jgi:3'(2'), 5'-bisphosphate nucleotidase
MIERNTNLNTAIQAALEAGEAIMKVYDSPDFCIEIKEDNSPLTQADKEANDIINTYLKLTHIPIISEENKQIAYATRKEWQQCWVVDPVDGTKEFIKRNGEFTVNIALVNKGVPELGVIYVPVTKTLYLAEVSTQTGYKAVLESHQVTIDDLTAKLEKLQPSPAKNKVKVVGSRSHMSKETVAYVDTLKEQGKEVAIVSKGSSLKFCLVAEGNADVYPRFAPTMEWDTAAGQAICNAVGVQVIAEDTKAPLLYNKENLLNPWFICRYDG